MSVHVDRELDLLGEVCPYTFVKSKLILEEMSPGEVLSVTVDYAPAHKNVPRSMRSDGHEVLEVHQVDDGVWEIVVRKGEI